MLLFGLRMLPIVPIAIALFRCAGSSELECARPDPDPWEWHERERESKRLMMSVVCGVAYSWTSGGTEGDARDARVLCCSRQELAFLSFVVAFVSRGEWARTKSTNAECPARSFMPPEALASAQAIAQDEATAAFADGWRPARLASATWPPALWAVAGGHVARLASFGCPFFR